MFEIGKLIKAPKDRVMAARAVAICADLLQIALFPMFSPGFISPVDNALDLAVCVVLTYLIGWHYSFLPSFLVKVAPMLDLAPTWTVAVFIATRGQRAAQQPAAATRVYENNPAPPMIDAPPRMNV